MMHVELPWELVEEILYRVPHLSIVRFKIVCKQWNTLFKSKSFVNNHLVHHVRPQFLIWTDSKMYSVSVNLNNDPKIETHELPLDISYLDNKFSANFLSCDGLLYCDSFLWNKAAVWNPWLRQTRWIESKDINFNFRGIGYNSVRHEKCLKILGLSSGKRKLSDNTMQSCRRGAIYELETNGWKWTNAFLERDIRMCVNDVSLNGNLYWVLINHETNEYFIQSFDFSKEIYKDFCVLPWNKNSFSNFPVLSSFRKDRLSVLRIIGKNNIEIWVTKNKINDDGEHVTWVKFMTVSIPNFSDSSISYFIDDVYKKTLVMCCKDEDKKLSIYIVRGNALITKIQIGVVAKTFIHHCSYVPSFKPVP